MTIKTDFHAVDHHGTRDYVLQCHKRPFALTVSPHLPKPAENLIDEELVEFLNIPIKKIEARRFSFAGIDSRIVGHVSQTVQCVVKGKVCGTTHLKAAVVRHLSDLYNLDCIAGGKTFRQLLSPDNLTNKSKVYVCTSDGADSEKSDDEESVRSTPSSTPRSRPPAATTGSPAPTTPSSTSRPSGAKATSPTPSSTPSSPSNSVLCEAWCYQGGKRKRFDAKSRHPVDERWQYNVEDEIWTLPYTKSGPIVKPSTPDHTVAYIQLDNKEVLTSFCNVVIDGWPMVASPKKTEPTTNISVQAVSSKLLCGDCGNHACQGTCPQALYYQSAGFYQLISSVDDPPYVVGHSGPPLPPDFSPCSYYCAYEDCDCVRQRGRMLGTLVPAVRGSYE